MQVNHVLIRRRALAAAAGAMLAAVAGCAAVADPEAPGAMASSAPAATVVASEQPTVGASPTPEESASPADEAPGVRPQGLTPTPRHVSRAAQKMEFTIFATHPEEWGGCYIDGDVVVVNTVTRSKAAAEQRLEELLGEDAPVRVVEVVHSIADLEAATDALSDVVSDAKRHGSGPLVHVTSLGPDYMGPRLHLGIDDENQVDDVIAAVREVLEKAFPGSSLVDIDVNVSITTRSTVGASDEGD